MDAFENSLDVKTLYLDFCWWGVEQSFPFWKLPLWLIIDLHTEFSNRYAKEKNIDHHVQAQIAAFGVNVFRAFTSKKGEQLDISNPKEFFAFQLPEEKDDFVKKLEENIPVRAAEIVVEVAKKGKSPRAIAEIKNIPELWRAICELAQYKK